ncbi:MAG: hypothetical protein WBQ20_16090 [Methyloceanibacter sp.]|jgi:hypothetical protein
MRYLPMILGAGLLSAGLLAGNGQAHAAMPALTLDRSAVADSPVEKVYYYRRHYYGYRPYHRRYYRPYGYYGYGYRPYGYYGYGRRWRY